MDEKIVIIGAGLSGMYSKITNINSILIDKSDHITIPTRLIYVVEGRDRSYAYTERKVDKIDEIKDVDFANRKVIGKDNSYEYDKLILALGSNIVENSIKGKEFMIKLQNVEDAEKMHMLSHGAGSINIIGGGYLGVELAGLFRGKNVNLIDANSRLLSRSNKKAALYAYNMLKGLNVNIILNERVSEVTADSVITDKNTYKADITIYAGGATGNGLVGRLNIKSSNSRVIVNDYLRTDEYDDVYACGDSMSIHGNNNPMTAYIARKSGITAMKNAMGHGVRFKIMESGNILNIDNHYVLFTGNSYIKGVPVDVIKNYVNNKTDKTIKYLNKMKN